jgi:hypothetical protein
LRPQRLVLFFAPLEIPRQQCRITAETEMRSINGTAMQSTQRDLNRAARGCPSIPAIDVAGWSRPFAKHYRELQTRLDP